MSKRLSLFEAKTLFHSLRKRIEARDNEAIKEWSSALACLIVGQPGVQEFVEESAAFLAKTFIRNGSPDEVAAILEELLLRDPKAIIERLLLNHRPQLKAAILKKHPHMAHFFEEAE